MVWIGWHCHWKDLLDKLTEANLEQNTISKQLFVSGQLPKLTISVFNGDPLQYPV